LVWRVLGRTVKALTANKVQFLRWPRLWQLTLSGEGLRAGRCSTFAAHLQCRVAMDCAVGVAITG
jgi:hypothetical protein